jgi:hypothetical protein
LETDGYDVGPYDSGGYDAQGGTFTWKSAALWNGYWNFGVKALDGAGNEGTAAEVTVHLICPPRPPALDASGNRLEYTYVFNIVTLSWLPSPG